MFKNSANSIPLKRLNKIWSETTNTTKTHDSMYIYQVLGASLRYCV